MISESQGWPELFLAVLGGRAPGCHIELHDVRFVAGATIEGALPELRRQWFGRREGLPRSSRSPLPAPPSGKPRPSCSTTARLPIRCELG